MHWYIGFTDPAPSAGPTLFEWAGGLPALTRMTRRLYEKHVPADPALAAAFADIPAGYPEQEARRIGEIFGGPPGGSWDGHPELTDEQRARWAALAGTAATEAGLPADPEFRAALVSYLEWESRQPPAKSGTPGSGAGTPGSGAGTPGSADTPGPRPAPRWDWTPAGPPDTTAGSGQAGTPGSQDGQADQADQAAAVTLPGPDEPVSFAAHIKPLFRDKDRQSMSFAFDLWSAADVREHATAILDRIRNGSMPCDTTWPQDWIDVLDRWTQTGTPD
jgi:truncated hemoglobin YjbI